MSRTLRAFPRPWIAWAAALVVGSVILAQAQLHVLARVPDATHFRIEYRTREVAADQVVRTLRDFGRNGWDVCAILPVWKSRHAGGDGGLIPRTYRVCCRKPVPVSP